MIGGRRLVAAALTGVLALAACGGDEARELAGYRRDPAPVVGDLSLPDLTADGADFALRAEPGGLLILYFGYTNCPDFCPTTLSDLRLAMRRMDAADAARIEVAMATVDPDRDIAVLAAYVTSFFEDGHALGTTEGDRLATVAAPFGVTYAVTTNDEGEIEVAHTTSLYAIDDQGELVLTWQFGVPIDELAADLDQLVDDAGAGR